MVNAISHTSTRSPDSRPVRDKRRPARYEQDEINKRTASAVEGTFTKTSRPAKRVKPIKRVALPKMPDSVRFTYVPTRRKSSAEVEREFLLAWEKAKQDPQKRDLKNPNCLLQSHHFIQACQTFFSKENANPFGITVEPATNPLMGRGAFITNGAKTGDVLGFYPLELECYSGRNKSPYLFCFDSVPELDNFSLDAQRVGPDESFTPFINDIPGCTNVKFVPYYTEGGPIMVLVAAKDFEKGIKTELSADYGALYWDAIGKKKQTIGGLPKGNMEVEEKEPPSPPRVLTNEPAKREISFGCAIKTIKAGPRAKLDPRISQGKSLAKRTRTVNPSKEGGVDPCCGKMDPVSEKVSVRTSLRAFAFAEQKKM